MHKIFAYAFTLLFGVLVAFLIASVVGAILPIAAIPVFLGLSICWCWIGWRYACARDRQRTQRPTHGTIIIGGYHLGQNITGLAGLTEISPSEYAALPKTFPRERIFRAPDITFLGYAWNLVLGTVDGFVYKLSAQFVSDLCHMAAVAFSESVMYCSNQFGKASLTKDGTIAKWDTSFGNVIVDTGSGFGQHYVNFQVTSGALVGAAASGSPISPSPMPEPNPVPDPVIPPPIPTQRSAKVSACIRTIESDLLKRTLSDWKENDVPELCSGEKTVVRLVKLEWPESTDVVDAFRRAQDRWERDHNRFV